MTCFARVGMKVPTRKGGGRCACGQLVRFDIPSRRTEHFLVCPVVDKRLAKLQRDVKVDDDAVLLGLQHARGQLARGV